MVLAAALLGGAWVARPFADALLVAAVVSALAWPLRTWFFRRVPDHPRVATVLALLVLTLGGTMPLLAAVWITTAEVVALLREIAADGALGRLVAELRPMVESLAAASPELGLHAVARFEDGVTSLGRTLAAEAPALVRGATSSLLDLVVFHVAVATFLHRGPELLSWLVRTVPMEESHLRRVYEVVLRYSREVVLAGLVTGLLQGSVAGVGYAIAGVERPVVFAALTAVASYVPFVGTPLAWGPVAVRLVADGRPGAALFVVIWSLALTGTVDNLIRPLLIGRQEGMPMLLFLVAVLGGLTTFGVVGALFGPLLLGTILALLTVWREQREGVRPAA